MRGSRVDNDLEMEILNTPETLKIAKYSIWFALGAMTAMLRQTANTCQMKGVENWCSARKPRNQSNGETESCELI